MAVRARQTIIVERVTRTIKMNGGVAGISNTDAKSGTSISVGGYTRTVNGKTQHVAGYSIKRS